MRSVPAKRVYAIIGPDGAGKTTIARQIAARLEENGVPTRIAWMRSPRIVTLGVLGILRLSRLAKTVRMGDHDDVHIDLNRHPVLFHLLAWSVTFDYFLGYMGKVTLPKLVLRRTVICDRFVWDAIVDLELASGLDHKLLDMPQGRILIDLGRKHRSVLVSAEPEELIRRRPILSLDPRLSRRLRLYEELATRFSLGTVDSKKTSEPESVEAVLAYLGIGPRADIAN
jgi:thymidylate kinase